MQYLLTSEEIGALHKQIDDKKYLPSKEDLQKFCTAVANELVLTRGWAKGRAWGCILNPRGETNPHYCDQCPSKRICPHPSKSWSK